MVKYAQNELFSITDFTKQIGSAVNCIKEHSLEKIERMEEKRIYDLV
jgi:hypothetical protein